MTGDQLADLIAESEDGTIEALFGCNAVPSGSDIRV